MEHEYKLENKDRSVSILRNAYVSHGIPNSSLHCQYEGTQIDHWIYRNL